MKGCRREGDDLILTLRIQPKASRDEVCGEHGDAVKIRITAPPVDGKANAHLIKYLAKLFRVPKGQVTVVSGDTGRDKVVRIHAPRELPDWAVSDR
ncbi:DUF167 family protein [Endothiovibrio diazotrophicus]